MVLSSVDSKRVLYQCYFNKQHKQYSLVKQNYYFSDHTLIMLMSAQVGVIFSRLHLRVSHINAFQLKTTGLAELVQ